MLSHEFRTPLTLILTPVEKLLKEVKDSDLRGQLVMIQRNGKRLLNLVNQLLDFRKMEVKRISHQSVLW
jgi:signal transduction histidine kinase